MIRSRRLVVFARPCHEATASKVMGFPSPVSAPVLVVLVIALSPVLSSRPSRPPQAPFSDDDQVAHLPATFDVCH